MSEPKAQPAVPQVDDRLRKVPEAAGRKVVAGAAGKAGMGAFVLTRIDALEKPRLEEELIEPGGGSPCSCNTVCPCVPDQTCVCNLVCTCDTVESCLSYSGGGGGGGGGYGGYYAPCH